MTRNSTKARRICFEAHKIESDGFIFLRCHVCKHELDPVREKWRADHIRRHAEGGEDTAENLYPICMDCDGGVGGKAADDTIQVAKGKRNRDKHFGIKQKTGFRKPPPGMKYDWKRGGYRRDDD